MPGATEELPGRFFLVVLREPLTPQHWNSHFAHSNTRCLKFSISWPDGFWKLFNANYLELCLKNQRCFLWRSLKVSVNDPCSDWLHLIIQQTAGWNSRFAALLLDFRLLLGDILVRVWQMANVFRCIVHDKCFSWLLVFGLTPSSGLAIFHYLKVLRINQGQLVHNFLTKMWNLKTAPRILSI